MNARNRPGGGAVLEFAIVLPLLLMMSYPLFDFFRAIQANLILISVSREGANLVSRSSYTTPQDIMDKLAATTPPLEMLNGGMIYVTKIMGQKKNNVLSNVILEQYRWQQGWATSNYTPLIDIWNCGSNGSHWATSGSNAGTCLNIPSNNRPAANLTMPLADGEVIYAVDVFYQMRSLIGFGSGLMNLQFIPDQYQARTIL